MYIGVGAVAAIYLQNEKTKLDLQSRNCRNGRVRGCVFESEGVDFGKIYSLQYLQYNTNSVIQNLNAVETGLDTFSLDDGYVSIVILCAI